MEEKIGIPDGLFSIVHYPLKFLFYRSIFPLVASCVKSLKCGAREKGQTDFSGCLCVDENEYGEGSMHSVYTVGYSNHEQEFFIALLTRNHITAVVDVRSEPTSRLSHFNQTPLRNALKQHNIEYVFLGRELGARREEQDCYVDGRVVYERVSSLPLFRNGLERIVTGAEKYTIAIMCAEKEPLDCHRTILICRNLKSQIDHLGHILADGRVEDHPITENRLLEMESHSLKRNGIVPGQGDLFFSETEPLELAYEYRGRKIAYRLGGEEEELDESE